MTDSHWYWKLLALLLLLPAGLMVLTPLPFSGLVPLSGLLMLLLYRGLEKSWPKLDWALYILVAAICLLAVLSTAWAVDPETTLGRAYKTSALLLLSLPLLDILRSAPENFLKRLNIPFCVCVLLTGLVAFIELKFNFQLYRLVNSIPASDKVSGSVINKNVAAFTLLLPIALAFCHRAGRYSLSILLAVAALLIAGITESQASQLALIAIPLVWLSLFVMPVAGISIAFTVIALVICLMPWLSPLAFVSFAEDLSQDGTIAKQASASMRLENWDFISRKIMENPWTGFGMDATRSIDDFQSRQLYFPSNVIMHPHNMALQVWIEFGVPGIFITIGFLGFLLRRFLNLPQTQRRLPFTVFCTVIVFLMISWSMWSGWLLALMIYAAGLTVLALKTSTAPAPSSAQP